MILGSWPVTIGALVALGGVTAVAGLWVRNYRKPRTDAPEATRKTSKRVVGVISGAVLAVAIAFVELSSLLGVIGDVVSMFPGGVTQIVLGAIAVAGFGGYLELGVVGATLLVVGILAASAAFTN